MGLELEGIREVGVVGVEGTLLVALWGETLEEDCLEKYLLAVWSNRVTEFFRDWILLEEVSRPVNTKIIVVTSVLTCHHQQQQCSCVLSL